MRSVMRPAIARSLVACIPSLLLACSGADDGHDHPHGDGATANGGHGAGGSGASGGASGTDAHGAGGSGADGAGGSDGGATGGVGGSGAGGSGGAVPGPDTSVPYPIDMGDAGAQTPGSYKGLPLRLTDNGTPAITPVGGVIGMVCIGMSNATQECSDFIGKLSKGLLTGKNASVKVVDCAVGGNAIESWSTPGNDGPLWDACIGTKLPNAGLTPSQVRVVYHKAAKQFTIVNPVYPASGSDYFAFYDDLSTFATRVKEEFPSLQAVYTTSRSYGGFSTKPNRGEPLSYEEGHALNTWLADHPAHSGVWHGWGPYIWAPDCATGIQNASGVCYVKSDYQADGIHPAQAARDKISAMIHARFLQEPWYGG
jgi:hypothetical protein